MLVLSHLLTLLRHSLNMRIFSAIFQAVSSLQHLNSPQAEFISHDSLIVSSFVQFKSPPQSSQAVLMKLWPRNIFCLFVDCGLVCVCSLDKCVSHDFYLEFGGFSFFSVTLPIQYFSTEIKNGIRLLLITDSTDFFLFHFLPPHLQFPSSTTIFPPYLHRSGSKCKGSARRSPGPQRSR